MLKLSSVDFSANRLTGSVPPGMLVIAGDEAFAGNPGLCIDGRSELGVCNVDDGHKNGLARRSRVLLPVLVSAMLLLVAGILFVSYRSFKLEEHRRDLERGERGCDQWKLESFHPPELDADEICGVGEENLVGSGGTGRVYRLQLKDGGGTVAVKRLWKGDAARVMAAEMSILGTVRHRNVLKLHACLSRGDLNFIVYEYMPRGNLYQALRREGKGGAPELDWPRRRRIALGAAKGLMYLHHDCTPAVIHRDIKSTDILLDEDLGPHPGLVVLRLRRRVGGHHLRRERGRVRRVGAVVVGVARAAAAVGRSRGRDCLVADCGDRTPTAMGKGTYGNTGV